MNASQALRLLISVCLVALVLGSVGPSRVGAAFAAAEPGWLVGGFCCSVASNLMSAVRWHRLLSWLGVKAPLSGLVLAYWRGIVANSILPGATLSGDALRALYLHRAGHSLVTAAVSVFLDRLSGLWVLATISLTGSAVALSTGLIPVERIPFSLPTAIALALLALTAPLLLWQLSAKVAQHLPSKVGALLNIVHTLPRPFAQYAAQIGWSGLVQLASILAFACGGWGIGLELPFWQFLIASGPIFIVAALPVTVGGWGTREAASALVLGALGAPQEFAVGTAVLYGMFATVLGVLGALTLTKRAST